MSVFEMEMGLKCTAAYGVEWRSSLSLMLRFGGGSAGHMVTERHLWPIRSRNAAFIPQLHSASVTSPCQRRQQRAAGDDFAAQTRLKERLS